MADLILGSTTAISETGGTVTLPGITFPTGFIIGALTAVNTTAQVSSAGSSASPTWVNGVSIVYTPQSGTNILLLVDAWTGTNGYASYAMNRVIKTPAGGSTSVLRGASNSNYAQNQVSSPGDAWQIEFTGGAIWDVHGANGSTAITYVFQFARQNSGTDVVLGRTFNDPTSATGGSAETRISILEIK